MKTSTVIKKLSMVAAGATLMTLAIAPQGKALPIGLPGWTGVGTYGTLGADGVVTLSPTGDSQYGYVSTYLGVSGVGLPEVVGPSTNGSTVTSPFFSANAGDILKFYFNYCKAAEVLAQVKEEKYNDLR